MENGLSKCWAEFQNTQNESCGDGKTDLATMMRDKLKEIEEIARSMTFEYMDIDKGEPYEQSLLALRHIEDARMRYGKVIQYSDDGVSIYDKK